MVQQTEPRVVIIGAGMSGTAMAIRMKKNLGLKSFTIYERAQEDGGTWRDNTYPGCACDVASHWYSLSTELNPEWESKFASQPEIKRYWKGIYNKNNLHERTVYNRTFKSASWDDEKSIWNITLYNSQNPDEEYNDYAHFLISAAGGLSNPNFQKQSLKGLSDFKGDSFHSAQWDHSVDLKNKKIALVGNGCSASQIVPVLSKDPSIQILNFMRTPSWYVPRDQYKYSDRAKWIFRNVPLAMWIYRNLLIAKGDASWFAWTPAGTNVRKGVQKRLLERMRAIVPEKYHEMLTPQYPMGCKRIILDPGYYESLARPNVELTNQKIDTFTEKGVRCTDGTEYEVDVICLATGFQLTSDKVALDLTARGKSLSEVWSKKGGPQAYYGTSHSNFPNFVTLIGPNLGSGNYSALGSAEMQITMVEDLLRPLVKNGVRSLEVKEEAEDAYNKEIQDRLMASVFSQCNSWYRNGMDGKITATKPGLWLEFWYRTRKAKYTNYIQKGGQPLKNATSAFTQFTLLAAAGAVALSAYRMNVLA